jgi:hypothetical protein
MTKFALEYIILSGKQAGDALYIQHTTTKQCTLDSPKNIP